MLDHGVIAHKVENMGTNIGLCIHENQSWSIINQLNRMLAHKLARPWARCDIKTVSYELFLTSVICILIAQWSYCHYSILLGISSTADQSGPIKSMTPCHRR